MKTSTTHRVKRGAAFMALAFSSLVITSCAMSPQPPPGAAQARSDLTALRNDPRLANKAPAAIREAEEAVRIAEQPLDEDDAELGQHRVYIADRKVSIAAAKATTRYAEEQRKLLAEERDEARLEARTREVREARNEAERARMAAEAAQISQAQGAAEYQRQIEALEAEITDRGVVVTLGDVLFASGSAELQSGDNSNLNKLVIFLNQYPKRQVKIEGHTDNVGSAAYNLGLSQRRAESVKNHLVQQGISPQRISTSGLGMSQPVASNDTATGRQQNRRVEIIIDNPPQT